MNTNKKIVLIVEKDVGIANMIRAILGIVDVAVIHVQTGTDASEQLAQNSTGLIICEKDLPDMNGYDLLNLVRSKIETSRIPFIMLIQETDASHEKLDSAKAADRYITKPFTARKVLDVVKEFIVYKGL